MHTHFREVADALVKRRINTMINIEDVTNLVHVLRLALKDNDLLRQGVAVQDSADCLTLADLDAIIAEIKDEDLRVLLNAKISRGLRDKCNIESEREIEG